MTTEKKEENKLVIQCVYCNAPWDAQMLVDYDAGYGCETCGDSPMLKIEITCSNCKRVVYVKEGNPTYQFN